MRNFFSPVVFRLNAASVVCSNAALRSPVARFRPTRRKLTSLPALEPPSGRAATMIQQPAAIHIQRAAIPSRPPRDSMWPSPRSEIGPVLLRRRIKGSPPWSALPAGQPSAVAQRVAQCPRDWYERTFVTPPTSTVTPNQRAAVVRIMTAGARRRPGALRGFATAPHIRPFGPHNGHRSRLMHSKGNGRAWHAMCMRQINHRRVTPGRIVHLSGCRQGCKMAIIAQAGREVSAHAGERNAWR
jgi:hypothetical protein